MTWTCPLDVIRDTCPGGEAQMRFTLRGLNGEVLRVFEGVNPHRDWIEDYVHLNGRPVAAIRWDGDATKEEDGSITLGEFTNYFMLDHPGSVRQVVDSSKNEVALYEYYPFGQEVPSISNVDNALKFTGHERDDEGMPESELDYMHARFCSPVLGRFLSVDPGPSNLLQPLSWNRYQYAFNSPQRYIDPSGAEVDFSSLSDEEQQQTLLSLNEVSGNVYSFNDKGFLTMLVAGPNSSAEATSFIDALISSSDVFTLAAKNNDPDVLFAQNPTGTNELIFDFRDFDHLDYGSVDPRAFSLGTNFIYEAAHAALGLGDPPPGRRFQELGENVAFVNKMRVQRGLPTRGPIYAGEPRGWLGQRRGINFQNVHPRRPQEIYYVEFPNSVAGIE